MEVQEDTEDAESRSNVDKSIGERREGCSSPRKPEKRKRVEHPVGGELPSPPPNPEEPFSTEEPRVSVADSASKAAERAFGVEAAFDHLDKLHSMMEEILEMRDRNGKLFRRVRELERIKATRKAHNEIERSISMGQDPLLPDEDVGFAESLLGAMLASSYEIYPRAANVARSCTSTKITRSRSIAMEPRRVSCPVTAESQNRNFHRSGQRLSEIVKKRPSLGLGTPKVSKWTRVKAAFKWERAACTTNDAPMEPAEVSVRYLRIPENAGGSSEVSGPPTPAGTISSSSSIDDVFHRPHRPSSHQSTRITRRDESSDPSRRSRSLDGEASVPMTFVYSPRTRSKDNACLQGKSGDPRSHKTPWGKVKDMMQLRRDSIGKQPTRSGSRNEDAHSISSIESSDIHRSEVQQFDGRPPRVRITADSTPSLATSPSKAGPTNLANDFGDLASRRLTPTLTITVPSSEELRSISSPESITPPPPARQNFETARSERFSQAGYETPKEIRTGQVSPASSSSGILRYGLGRSKTCQAVPSAGDFKRQRSLKGESLGSSPKMQRRDSKWNKVKRAFLTSATSVPTSPSRISSYFFDDGDGTGGSYSASASAEDLDNDGASNPGAQAEIQRNYRLLHDKLGTEFYRKLAEWEKLKTSASRDSTKANARERESENLRLLGEERLTPEFKKKLEEWKRMNKGAGEARGSQSSENRSVNRRRITDWQLWRSPSKPDSKPEGARLSDDFIKKMDEWKRIKSTAARRDAEVDEETRQPDKRLLQGQAEDDEEEEEEEERRVVAEVKLSEERRRRAWKSLEDQEFRSLERVLEAMEIDRQTRLSKLQRIVGLPPQRTQEVLIHTSTGLYRFEGISRKFTRKLYEWEKSQGISPELSTFRLLDPHRHGVGSLRSRGSPADAAGDGAPRRTLYRSKSVGSVQTNAWRTTREHEKQSIRRPSSLSLNDMDNLEARSCIIASSVPTIPDEEDTSEDIAMEDSEAEHEREQEPEAVIVDIEDVIEETASPLRKYQPHQTPVYSVAGSETTSIAIPLGTVTARHEPSPVILIEPGEVHPLRARASSINDITDVSSSSSSSSSAYAIAADPTTDVTASFSFLSTEQQQRRSIARDRRAKREDRAEDEAHLRTVDNVTTGEETPLPADHKHNQDMTFARKTEEGEGNNDLMDSDKNWQMIHMTHDRNPENRESRANEEDEEAFEEAVVTVHRNVKHSKKILKTRRLTDTQVGYDWRSINKPSTSNEPEDRAETEESLDTCVSTSARDFQDNPNLERIIINEETINKIVVPTASSSATISSLELDPENRNSEIPSRKEKREANSVFVKTKRIVFSPFRREGKKLAAENVADVSADKSTATVDHTKNPPQSNSASSPFVQEAVKSASSSAILPSEPSISNLEASPSSQETNLRFPERKRPPLPKSPVLARKEYRISSPKETAPSIRMMIKRYNEKLETESGDRNAGFSVTGMASSANSSGSGSSSPSWRTPVIERRLLTRMERYDEAKKPVGSRGICCSSCSASCEHISGLSKSASADFLRQTSNLETRRDRTNMQESLFSRGSERRSPSTQSEDTKSMEANNDRGSSLTIRAMKIRRAKEDFLSRGPSRDESSQERQSEVSPLLGSSSGPREIEETKEEVEPEDCAVGGRIDLIKSASAGMINVDADTFERLQSAAAAAAATRVSDSLPRSNQHLRHPAASKETASRFSQIARKFKRAKLRRAKEKESGNMSTVSMLCRQSLLVDIVADSGAGEDGEAGSSKSDPATTPGSQLEAEEKKKRKH